LHDYIRQAVQQRYLQGHAAEVQATHGALADYYLSLPLHVEREDGLDINTRKVAEMPFHLRSAGRIGECVRQLLSLSFVEAKCSCGLLYDLLQDFRACSGRLESAGLTLDEIQAFNQMRQMLAFNLPLLRRLPGELLGVAVNQPDSFPIAQQARDMLEARGRPYFAWLNKPQARSRSIMHLEGHQAPVYACAIRGTKLASGSRDGQLRFWSLDTGDLLHVLSHHQWAINSLAWIDDDHLVAVSDDASLSVSNAVSGALIKTVSCERDGCIQCVTLTGQGTLALTSHSMTNPPLSSHSTAGGGNEGVICLWSTADWQRLARLPVSGGIPVSIRSSSDGLCLALECLSSAETTVRVWERPNLSTNEYTEAHRFAMRHSSSTDLRARERHVRCV
jgi:hypothetical protein